MAADAAGIDYSQYGSWKQIKAPTGAIYYIVPGTGYVYDPFLSAQKGRPVLWTNPQPSIDERDTAKKQEEDARKAAEAANSPIGQLAPVAGTVGGLYLANQIANGGLFGGSTPASQTVAALQQSSNAGAVGANQAVGGVQEAFINGANGGSGSGGAGGGGLVDGLSGGGEGGYFANGGAAPQGSFTLGNIAAGAGAAYGAYQTANALQNNGEGLRTGLTTLGGGLGGFAGPLGAVGGAAVGNAVGYGLQSDKPKNDLALAAMGPVTWPLLAAKKLGIVNKLMHKSTKQYEQERWGGLKEEGVADAEAAYAANHPEGDTGVWQDGEFAGKKWNFEDAKTLAQKDPSQFRLVYGNYKTFGNDWSSYAPDKQDAIVSQLISEGLYKPNKGDILISDEKRAREIKDSILNATGTPTAVTPEVAQKTQGVTTKLARGNQPYVANPVPTIDQSQQAARSGPLMNPMGRPGGILPTPGQAPAQAGGRLTMPSPIEPGARLTFPAPTQTPPGMQPLNVEQARLITLGKELARRQNERR
ncbi:hypothetical protein UFOVP591_16 [uncultured Caudovirales phage]|uniref:Uncharacterized protein n=1 Tax=uncultured Caudovirales phage TaxID=2100421 RepID=A0A6J5N2D2_9CAUD|nr:hypothetical protein UFOVP591_16 [uncultured Caudovirales phage]